MIVILLSFLLGETAVADSEALTEAYQQYQQLKTQGRFADAEPFARRALELGEQQLGQEHKTIATLLNNLAYLYYIQGRYTEAGPLYKRSLVIWEKALGPDDLIVAQSTNNLAILYDAQGRYEDAEPLLKRSLKIREKALGPDHLQVAQSLNNLAALHVAQGRYGDAEPLYKRSLAILEKAFGAEHPEVAHSLNNLAVMYYKQGRYGDAESLHKRSLAIKEKTYGLSHPDVAQSLNNLAILYNIQSRHADAEPLFKRSLAIKEKAFGPDHPEVAQSLSNLAEQYRDQGRYADAEPLFKRALAIFEKSLVTDHPSVATSLNELATLYDDQGRYADAEPLFQRSLALREKALGPDHPDVAGNLNNLAGIYHAQGKTTLALDYIRRSSAIYRSRAARAEGYSEGRLSEQKTVRFIFMSHIAYAAAAADKEPEKRAALTAEAFEVSQLARATSVGAAVAGMSARFAARDNALAKTVRRYQDATKRWQWLDKKLIDAVSQPPDRRNETAERGFRTQLENVDGELKGLDERLIREFPEYAELASPKPIPLEDASKLLGPDEALLAWLTSDNETFLWVVRSDLVTMKRLDIGRGALTQAVDQLRDGLDPVGVERLSDIPAFDTFQAFDLYQKFFAPAEPLLDGVSHIFVIPDGALQSLPLAVLVAEKPQEESIDFADYHQVHWLASKYALTTLPTVSSLRALRHFAQTTHAKKPFRGFGDPLLEGHPGNNRGVKMANLFKSRGIADVSAIRSRLAPLPETADELKSMASILGASNDDLFLRDKATEHIVKTADLKDYRVLAFATHGLISGDLQGLAEPALVLTPPETGTLEDDGLLTAGEVAQLQLNSDLVILSACNTASADGSVGAEALSGLAKAFFYAGSRTLLVSHWPVSSHASVKLTTRMLKEAANDKVGHAEALRRSMSVLMEDKQKPHYAHPMFWAPFVVVGEGGTYRFDLKP